MLKLNFKKSIVLFVVLLTGACNQQKSMEKKLLKESRAITEAIVDFGPRVSNTDAHKKVQDYIEQYLKSHQIELQKDHFIANTPLGKTPMTNLRYAIQSEQAQYPSVLLAAHYDSKHMPGKTFLGVNDAATSVALILALTPMIQSLKLPYIVEVIFFDGEEAFEQWSPTDSLYGSRHFAQTQARDAKIAYAMLLDMISDKELNLVQSHTSDAKLTALYKKILQELNMHQHLDEQVSFIEDDHLPLIRAGIPTLHIMDFTYGSATSPGKFWHTEEDNLDNVSFENTAKVGTIVLKMLEHFQKTMQQ